VSAWRDPATGSSLGSTTYWRKLRQRVFVRDRWICGLCRKPINRYLVWPHPMSATVHHLISVKTYDMRFLVASHKQCNQRLGSPERNDPEPLTITKW
jgi:5-methylcytosine-specific restriction endonuclease McrA